MKPTKSILPVIVFCQFFCTSLWFAGNAVLNDLIESYDLKTSVIGDLTSAVQFGFIIGTLAFAILTISDRFSPSKVFLVCAILGASFNLGITIEHNQLWSILTFRFLTGFCLAGIYPVGMKIAADYYEKGLGKSLGYLVGALVLGTALPHLLKDLSSVYPWKSVIISTSVLASIGGILMFSLVPDGPFRKASHHLNLSAFFSVFKNQSFRSAAFGYFGHMWELYAFWTFVPFILKTYNDIHTHFNTNIPLVSFFIIAAGGLSCILGGYISKKIGSKKVAFLSLLLSCICCLLSPFLFSLNHHLFLLVILFWGMVVVSDSPQFSTLVATNVATEIKGTALTIVNCIGFAITIFSIQLITNLQNEINPKHLYIVLSIGPILGLIALTRNKEK
ncbi:MFS transporter [Aestuariibaculum lutulentum]|uniref:MFS transporter n=1 Tax=Aestuariibaculum lutulentum TaxID=2920935 RepID=A0ABS9RI97_9FLAO|nr:MFS transporter [Aestuariibaculum lutulentum]MCH4552673.1 MFS transporter [Aestuariibaculum lutulentum]